MLSRFNTNIVAIFATLLSNRVTTGVATYSLQSPVKCASHAHTLLCPTPSGGARSRVVDMRDQVVRRHPEQ